MNTGYRVSQRQETGLRVDPKLLLSSQILQQSLQELTQAIEAELNENPALERTGHEAEEILERDILRNIAPRELRPRGDDRELWRSLPTDDDTPSWIDLTPSDTSLAEHLRAQLLPNLTEKLRHVGDFVIGSLTDTGYLYEPVEEVALGANCSIEEAEFVIRELKKCDPPGVGASGIQEALILQLKSDESLEGKVARQIVRDHLDLFTSGKRMKLARRFSVTPDVINEAFERILACSPFPGDAYRPSSSSHEARLPAIQPDLVLTRSEMGWEVAVKGPSSMEFTVNGYYKKRFEELQTERSKDKDERRHLAHYLERANNFIESLEQRHKTLMKIGYYLIEKQSGFVSTGNHEFLLPLTRTQLAYDLGVHESTISRATQGKFVQLSSGETVSFEVFFKPALRVQKMIEDILATENPDNPLSDERIAAILATKGVHVARRTVNKYRDRTKLLSSRKRNSA